MNKMMIELMHKYTCVLIEITHTSGTNGGVMNTNNDPMYFFKLVLKNTDSLNKIKYSGNRIKINDP